MSDERIARHVVAKGRVQGVGYRAFVERQARQFGVDGWVRNRRDGTVEAVFAGTRQDVEAIIADCRKGPSSAAVSAVELRDATDSELAMASGGFSVLPTI